jgi:hypothetical protein
MKTIEDDSFLATALEDATRVPSELVPGGLFMVRSYRRQRIDERGSGQVRIHCERVHGH